MEEIIHEGIEEIAQDYALELAGQVLESLSG